MSTTRRSILKFLSGATAAAICPQKLLGKEPKGEKEFLRGQRDAYRFGKGELTFKTTNVAGEVIEISLGNVTEFDLYTEIEELEHHTSRGGLKRIDSKVEISRSLTFSGRAEADPSGNMMNIRESL